MSEEEDAAVTYRAHNKCIDRISQRGRVQERRGGSLTQAGQGSQFRFAISRLQFRWEQIAVCEVVRHDFKREGGNRGIPGQLTGKQVWKS
jgi:hypothetical protein